MILIGAKVTTPWVRSRVYRNMLRPPTMMRDLAESTLQQREPALALTHRRVAARLASKLELTQAEAALPATCEHYVHETGLWMKSWILPR